MHTISAVTAVMAMIASRKTVQNQGFTFGSFSLRCCSSCFNSSGASFVGRKALPSPGGLCKKIREAIYLSTSEDRFWAYWSEYPYTVRSKIAIPWLIFRNCNREASLVRLAWEVVLLSSAAKKAAGTSRLRTLLNYSVLYHWQSFYNIQPTQ